MKLFRHILCVFTALSAISFPSFAHRVDATVSFRKASAKVDCYRVNNDVFATVDEAVSSGKLLRIVLRSYSSPDGSLAANRRISSSRAASVMEEIQSRCPDLPENAFHIIEMGEDWSGAERVLRSKNYAWKDEALEIMKSSGEERKQLLQELYVGEAWDALMKNVFPSLRRVELTFIYALEEGGEHNFDVLFPCGVSWISERYKDNSSALSSLSSLAASSPDTIYIKSYASIDGTVSANVKLCEKRANSVRTYLVSEGYDASKIVILNLGEDWEGFAKAVKSSNLDNKEDILEILDDSSTSVTQKKKLLRQLDGGRCWKRLCSGIMPSLRRVVVQ